jgi:hypothetical protein
MKNTLDEDDKPFKSDSKFALSATALQIGRLFCLAWTFIKVFCFYAGGVVLALIAGILFGGVLQGTVMPAFGATVGLIHPHPY